MPDAPKKFYLTTPIYYVNARPHIGHAYSTIVADVLARRHRLLGDDTYFLTGTDEHGQKIERAAAAAGIPPQQYADQVSKTFSDLWARMGITHDQFIRTTSPKHVAGAQKLFADLYDRGQIYLSSYTGQYSVGEEMFVEGPPGTLGPDGKPTETVTEENFFFRLSDFQLPLLDLIDSNTLTITPESSRNEVISFLTGNVQAFISENSASFPSLSGKPLSEVDAIDHALENGLLRATRARRIYLPGALRDLSVSRSSFTWGIPVPEPAASETKQKHVIYVWLDALANYMTALGYGSEDETLWQKFWPADIHLVGKEITRFHCVYWPAFLLAAGLPLPKQVTANGWLLFDNSKMSKSKGNVVRTETILDAFGTLCPVPAVALSSAPFETLPDSVISTEAQRSGETPVFRSPLQHSVLSEGARHHPAPQPKDLLSSDTPTPPAESTNRRGTASAVPLDAPALKGTGFSPSIAEPSKEGALVPEGTPTPPDRDLFAADILRYYLLREIPFGQDGSFSFDSLITRYNADLANGYGNLVSRTLGLIQQNFGDGLHVPTKPWLCPDQQVYWEGQEPTLPNEARSGTRFIITQVFNFVEFSAEHLWPTNKLQIFLAELALHVSHVDSYLSFHKPWMLAKSSDDADKKKFVEVLYTAAESIRIITALLYPILPYATARVWKQLGFEKSIEQAAADGDLRNLQWGGLKPGAKLGPLSPIFPRAPKELSQTMTDMENPATPPSDTHPESPLKSATTPAPPAPIPAVTFDPAAPPRTSSLDEPSGTLPVAGSTATTTHNGPTPSHTEAHPSGIFANAPSAPSTLAPEPSPTITIDDFAKIDLRVAQIVLAERIPKADKLLRLEVDLGPLGRRQILSGIAEFYTPEDLLGRRIVVIANLAPRKMRGLESHGMLLAAAEGDHGKPALASCGDDIPLGSRLK